MSLMRTGPGPVWAKGGEMVTVSLGSEVSGISKASGGRLIRRLTLTVADAMLARDWREGTEGVTSISVIFQKAFQKCTSRFCVIRSNSAPRSSGSMAKRPLPCGSGCYDTSPMEMVCRNGRMEGVNCGETLLSPIHPRREQEQGSSEG
uniref:Uncharacterized protein n=1 Tax=Urocitellus parryii TaxID=9999 RepID=A0A8D2GJC7_UROPR